MTEVIAWDDGRSSVEVGQHEVFSWEESADLFATYYLLGDLPARYALRPLVSE
ncbi:hypothetical protein [Tenggerimyces flavus]|uniref:Uncharacterized protein n=1 Tax=Tenggerimyces flavus TaxID=1708749 RepID=A0ABV7Y4D7_9ACTN|nr:hypothetical protein [Tenggerimyces flavus]MBM7790568.1 hypothetical protein [Tenggerimyces flavus]